MGLFQNLPGELRNKIYLYIASPYPQITHACYIWVSDETFSAAILRTCRQINLEATPILYSSTCFKLSMRVDFNTQAQQQTPELLCQRTRTLPRWPSPLMKFVRFLDIKLCFGMKLEHQRSSNGLQILSLSTTFRTVASNFPALECLVLCHCLWLCPNRNPAEWFTGDVDAHARVHIENCLKHFMRLPKLKKILLGVYCNRNDQSFGTESAKAVGPAGRNWSGERQRRLNYLFEHGERWTAQNLKSHNCEVITQVQDHYNHRVIDIMIGEWYSLHMPCGGSQPRLATDAGSTGHFDGSQHTSRRSTSRMIRCPDLSPLYFTTISHYECFEDVFDILLPQRNHAAHT